MQVAEVFDDAVDECAQLAGDATQVDGTTPWHVALCLGRLDRHFQRSLFTRRDRDVGTCLGRVRPR